MSEHDDLRDLEDRIRRLLRGRADELTPPSSLPLWTLRRTRRRIVRTLALALLTLGLVAFGMFSAVGLLRPTSVEVGSGATDMEGAAKIEVTFHGTLDDAGCTFAGPTTLREREEIEFILRNEGSTDFFVDVLRFEQGKTYDDLLAYIHDPGEDPEVRPSWAVSDGVFLAQPRETETWKRTLAPGEYALACFTTSPPRLWPLAPLSVGG